MSGDRFHEWLGARSLILEKGVIKNFYPDFLRVRRQQILLKEIIKKKFNFMQLIRSPYHKGLNINAINILKKIDNTWNIKILLEKYYRPVTINGYDSLELIDIKYLY